MSLFDSYKFTQQMNRVPFSILEEQTTPKIAHVLGLEESLPKQIGYVSQKFPVYPIVLHLFLDNPPFNKFSVSFAAPYLARSVTIYASQNNIDFFKIYKSGSFSHEEEHYVHNFTQKQFAPYLRVVFEQPLPDKANPCKQLQIRAMEVSFVSFYQTRFVCCLEAKISHHPVIYRLMELQEYKMLLYRDNNRKLADKYQKSLQDMIESIASKQLDRYYPDSVQIAAFSKEIARMESEPVQTRAPEEAVDPLQTKKDIHRLQRDLNQFAIDRLVNIKPHIKHYFSKYHNNQVRDIYLRLLSSSEYEDHNKALVSFWGEVKQLKAVDTETEQAVLMFFNFFLENLGLQTRTSAVKILILFSKWHIIEERRYDLDRVYERILHNIIKIIHQKEENCIYEISLRYCYILFQKLSNDLFLKQVLNAYRTHTLAEQIQKLEILEKVTFRGVEVHERGEIVQFLIYLLLKQEISLTVKNRAYNIAAYLSALFGKENVMRDFEQLNSMILMTMERNIDEKVGRVRERKQMREEEFSCEYCGITDPKFKDENLYDLHLAKECRYISTCSYCQQNVETPELFKHYVEQCPHKNEFKHCQDCFEVIRNDDEGLHREKCEGRLTTKCPLCLEKVDNKLKLKEHLLVDGCPNNPRD